MAALIQDRLKHKIARYFVGRTRELATLLAMLNDEGPIVSFVHGIGGIGKSSLLDAFASEAQSNGAVVLRLDCREIKPSIEGFLQELATAVGIDCTGETEVLTRVATLGNRVVIALDTYEVFRMMDPWLRSTFIPKVSDNARFVFFGREAPVEAWRASFGWSGTFQSIRLDAMSKSEAQELLRRVGIREADIDRVVRFTRGHPLAMTIAAAAILERPELNLQEIESQHVVEELTRLYLIDVPDPVTRTALEAASVVRRTTHSLVRALLPESAPSDTYQRLASLPFVTTASDGLMMHDLVQQAVTNRLRATSPDRYYAYQRAAWKQLRSEFPTAGKSAVWRYTADMIYLIDHPGIREAFFPSDAHLYTVEPAMPEDFDQIRAIALQHDGPEMLDIMEAWWGVAPDAFYVARGRGVPVAGYYCMVKVQGAAAICDQINDPITNIWKKHLRSNRIPDDQMSLFSLRWIAAETGEAASAVQGALWLDIKRTYMEFPKTRRIYNIVHDAAFWLPILGQLGFVRIDEPVMLDGKSYTPILNDFGPNLVPGWMTHLVDAQLGIERPQLLDSAARQLLIDDQRVGLTPLEFELMHYLCQHEGRALTRDELLDQVWGYDYVGGSNIVDAMVRSLRKKLGPYAGVIETVTGVGYRYRPM